MDIMLKGLKVPPGLRLVVATGQDIGDAPTVKILNPRNLPEATAHKMSTGQYELVFAASCVGETVTVSLIPEDRQFFGNLLAGFLSLFTFHFWLSLLPGKGFVANFSWQRFMVGSLIASGFLFLVLVAIELTGVQFHKKYFRWLNTMEMVSNTVDKIQDITGLNESDPFFKSSESDQYYMRTGNKLHDDYLVMSVKSEDDNYRMLISKNFFAAKELDDAQEVCAGDIGGELPSLLDYRLLMKNESLFNQLNFAFAEWTTYPKGIVSDDYFLWLLPMSIKTYEQALENVNTGSSEALDDLADNYNIEKAGLADDEFKELILRAIKNDLRLPQAAETVSENGKTLFYLDENYQANFRCVRKLPALQ